MSEDSSQPKQKPTQEELEKRYREAGWLTFGRGKKQASVPEKKAVPSAGRGKPLPEVKAGPEVKAVHFPSSGPEGAIRLTEEQRRRAQLNQELLRARQAELEEEREELTTQFDEARQTAISMHPSGSALRHWADMNVTKRELEDFIRDAVSGIDVQEIAITGNNFSIKLDYAVRQFGGGLGIVVSSTLTHKSIVGTFSSRGVVVHHAY